MVSLPWDDEILTEGEPGPVARLDEFDALRVVVAVILSGSSVVVAVVVDVAVAVVVASTPLNVQGGGVPRARRLDKRRFEALPDCLIGRAGLPSGLMRAAWASADWERRRARTTAGTLSTVGGLEGRISGCKRGVAADESIAGKELAMRQCSGVTKESLSGRAGTMVAADRGFNQVSEKSVAARRKPGRPAR